MATEIKGKDRPSGVVTKTGKEIPCDFVCIAVGIVPNVELAQQAGLEVNNGVLVNEYMQTSNPDIYAAGDVCNYPDPVFGRRRRVEHWGHAKYSGQAAGLNMAGAATRYDMLSYVWSNIFDLRLDFVGDETDYDRMILRGKFEDKSFIALYLKNNVLTSYLAVNTSPREFITLQRLIGRKKDLTDKDDILKDPAADIKSLRS
jgi:NADPH-dependent 2,4-dienoyl-CoA reductase/sulfur reductase-like enzyme